MARAGRVGKKMLKDCLIRTTKKYSQKPEALGSTEKKWDRMGGGRGGWMGGIGGLGSEVRWALRAGRPPMPPTLYLLNLEPRPLRFSNFYNFNVQYFTKRKVSLKNTNF